MKEALENYYGTNGDQDWSRIVKSLAPLWVDSPAQMCLLQKVRGLKDFAIVINDRIGEDYAASWLQKKIPALDNLRPADCLESETLQKRLKEALMRM